VHIFHSICLYPELKIRTIQTFVRIERKLHLTIIIIAAVIVITAIVLISLAVTGNLDGTKAIIY